MIYLESFTTLTNKSVLILHGYGGRPAPERTRVLGRRGYRVYYPHIDYDKEYAKDKCQSITSYLVERYSDVDAIIGLSLGGYMAFILANKLHKPCVLINPALNRKTTRLNIKDFDYDFDITNPRTEIFFGENDIVVDKNHTIDYLNKINYKYIDSEIKMMEHGCPLNHFKTILNRTKIIR